MTTRIYISGILPHTTQSDLGQLLSKVGKVEEIYIPSKSLQTGKFAIARIAGLGDENTAKTIKALSGSTWKGCKIKLELAHEWYKDRIMREKQEDLHKPQVMCKPAQHQPSQQEYCADILRIRKVKGRKMMRISTAPIVFHEGQEFRPSNINISSLKVPIKQVFQYDLADLKNYELVRSEKKSILETDLHTKSGKGVRKGFGSITLQSPIDCCIESQETIVEDDFQIVAPCVAPDDLLPENLLKERNRALYIMSSLGNKTKVLSSETTNTEKHVETNGSDFILNDQSVLKTIFAKEGGVWWDNVDNVKDATKAEIRGDISKEDLIFKEAEQFGFDIRDASKAKSSSFSFNFGCAANSQNINPLKSTTPHGLRTIPPEIPVLFNVQEIWEVAGKFHRKR
jgi:hypothetical protein